VAVTLLLPTGSVVVVYEAVPLESTLEPSAVVDPLL
jgi:hypothetical protein